MKRILLPMILSCNWIAAQYSTQSTEITPQHEYLFKIGKEINLVQGTEDEQWNYEHIYDDARKKIVKINNKRTYPDGTSTVFGVVTFQHDEYNRIIKYQEETKDSNDVWAITEIISYQYDNNGRVSTIIQEDYDEEAQQHKVKRRYYFTYDHLNNVTKIIWEWYNSSLDDIVPLYVDNYEYDAQGKLIKYLRTTAPDANNQTTPIDQRTYQYENEKAKGFIWQRYLNNRWVNHFEQVLEYDENDNNNVYQKINYLYNRSTGVKRENTMFVYSYDINIENDKIYSFKEHTDLIYLFDNWYKNKNAGISTRMHTYDHHPTVNGWKITKSINTEYEKISTNSLNIYTVNIQQTPLLYPNPAKDYLTLNTNEKNIQIQIFDSAGNLVKSFKNHQDKYPIWDLPTGIYIVHTKINNTSQTIKLIKQ